MKKLYFKNTLLTTVLIMVGGCATIIGGNTPTYKTTGSRIGPATLAESDANLSNNRYAALTIGGNLTATKITIYDDLNIKGSAMLTKVTVKDDTTIGRDLICDEATFEDATRINGNLQSEDSYFGNGVSFGGEKFILNTRSKVIGNIVSTNPNGAQVVIDRSTVKGNISFNSTNGVVIIRNKGILKGQVTNGSIKYE